LQLVRKILLQKEAEQTSWDAALILEEGIVEMRFGDSA
jgi:hypothetical protein